MALMEIESEETKDGVVVVEKAELDIDVQDGEGGQSNGRVVLVGLAGKGKSSTSWVSSVEVLSEIEETESGNGTKLKAKLSLEKYAYKIEIALPGTECLPFASKSNKDVEVHCSEEPWGVWGITASAELVVINVETLAIEARNFCSLIGCGKTSGSPSRRSFTVEP